MWETHRNQCSAHPSFHCIGLCDHICRRMIGLCTAMWCIVKGCEDCCLQLCPTWQKRKYRLHQTSLLTTHRLLLQCETLRHSQTVKHVYSIEGTQLFRLSSKLKRRVLQKGECGNFVMASHASKLGTFPWPPLVPAGL